MTFPRAFLAFTLRFATAIALTGGIASFAIACPDVLKSASTRFLQRGDLCSLHDRYENALQILRRRGYAHPERLGNIMAPRFINFPDWLKNRDRSPSRAAKIYDPAPLTWTKWEAGAALIDASARENVARGRLPILTLEWMKTIHAATLDKLLESAGRLRTGGEVGMALKHELAVTRAQAEAARAVEYPAALTPNARLLRFHPTECLEDRSDEFKALYKTQSFFYFFQWPEISPDRYFKAEDGLLRQCGYLDYAPVEEVEPQLQRWLAFINAQTDAWAHGTFDVDPLLVAARAQRWFVAIHPYEDGNGRMSRFMMDWLLESLGLPAPILAQMDEDVYSTEEQWATQVGDGLLRALNAAETCVLRPGVRGCTEINLAGSRP